MALRILGVVFFVLFFGLAEVVGKSLRNEVLFFDISVISDSLSLKRDAKDMPINKVRSIDTTSFSQPNDTLPSDSLNTISTPYRKPFLEAPIKGTNQDSLVYDVLKQEIFVYKQGEIEYQDINLKADYIQLSTKTKNLYAKGIILDTVSKEYSRPVFIQSAAEYTVDSMNYNMDSGKARIKGVDTKEGEGILYGGTVKKMKDNTIHMHQGRYTVCDAECPHYYIQMTKGTTIPNKQIVFGPSYLVFEGVPLYFLGLPFGFFPQQREHNSGLIFPSFGEEAIKGFFMSDLGYYFAINDYVDLRFIGSIYTLGSWRVGTGANYSLRYKFQGNVGFDFASDKIGDSDSPDFVDSRNMSIRWTHAQDAKFKPGSTFSASVNYSSSSYNKYNSQTMDDYLNSQVSSSINYSKNWTGKPFSLSINGSMSQNSRDSTITLNLPSMSFNVSRIAPFKRKNKIGDEKWYEKISFTYGLEMKNDIRNIKEDKLFKPEMFEQMRTGARHSIPVSSTFNLFQYLNITPSINYNERWYFRSVNQVWDAAAKEGEGAIVMDTTKGFYRVYDYGTSLSFSTKLYGTYALGSPKKLASGEKKPALFRHIFTPSISANYTPDNGTRYMRSVQSDVSGTEFREYNPFAGELYGTPSTQTNAGLSFSFSNTLEAKFPSKRDTSGYIKVKLLEQLNISSSYNFMADSMKLSPFSTSLSTNIANKLPITVNASFDPYQLNESGRRINKFLINDGGFLRLTSLSFSFGYSFKSKSNSSSGSSNQPAVNNPLNNDNLAQHTVLNTEGGFFDNALGLEKPEEAPELSPRELAMLSAAQYYDFSIPWSFSFNYNFQYNNRTGESNIQHSVRFNGSLNLTNTWALSTSAGYDFTLKKLTPGTISITKDLHCFQMSFQWVPVGFRQSWSFNISAKASTLADLLKWDKDRSFIDNQFSGFQQR